MAGKKCEENPTFSSSVRDLDYFIACALRVSDKIPSTTTTTASMY